MPQSTLLLLLLLLLLILLLLLRILLNGSTSAAGPIVDKTRCGAWRSSSRLLHLLLLFDLLALLGGHWLALAELLEEGLLLHCVVLLLRILVLLLILLLLLLLGWLLLLLLFLGLFPSLVRHAFFLHRDIRWGVRGVESGDLAIVHGLLGRCEHGLLGMALLKLIARRETHHAIVLLLLLDS